MTKWVTKKLGEVLTIGNGQDYKHLHNGEIPVYGTGGVMTFVDDYLYDGETVCIGRKGTINKPIYFNGKIWTVDTLFYTHSFVDVLPKYVYYAFCCVDWLRFNEATGVPSLSKETIYKIEIPIPALPDGTPDLAEQRRIAGILSSADGAIAASEALIEKYRNIKRGLLTTLLQPKEGWKKVKLGECCEPSSEKYNPLIQTEFKDCIEMENMEQGSGTINGTSDISKLLSIKNTFRKGDVLYGKLRPYLRKYWLAQFDGVCSTEIWVLRHSEFIDAQFLFYLFQTELINKIANLSSGTKMPRADWSLMQNQELFIPDLAEQRRIAEILSSVDAKIAAEEKVVEKYKGVKKGLMESMMKEKEK